jgi:hypothetical protein
MSPSATNPQTSSPRMSESDVGTAERRANDAEPPYRFCRCRFRDRTCHDPSAAVRSRRITRNRCVANGVVPLTAPGSESNRSRHRRSGCTRARSVLAAPKATGCASAGGVQGSARATVAGAIEDQPDDTDREVGVVELDVVIAAGREDVRGERLEVDERRLDLRPDLLELTREVPGAVANGSVLLITASGIRGRLALLIALIAPSTSTVSQPGSFSSPGGGPTRAPVYEHERTSGASLDT